MLMDPTFTHWTAVYRSAGEDEPTATTADFSEMGAGDPVDARAAKAHFRTALDRGAELLELYPFDNPDEALETWRATNALEVAGL
ncbi:hypothetical protein T8T21_18280 (plasmid) [Limimaricola variabilis]|uniref:hypothetical protein n=1 Tax=Limimaricola variabilis TaxID=1492771 RepID=UPI002AC8F955|nr:hypothetical protein [Limimaricola variabilis]WPY96450.1 hypothetical protein T8T21_18280 [Limimaricola variabilis]